MTIKVTTLISLCENLDNVNEKKFLICYQLQLRLMINVYSLMKYNLRQNPLKHLTINWVLASFVSFLFRFYPDTES